jgi:CRISPR-associated endonuclease/helicase Cas3
VFDESRYRNFFQHATGRDAHEYQVKVARQLVEGTSVVLRAPTGAGKTWSVLVPFFYPDWRQRKPARLIYALPLRTVAQGIYREARQMAQQLGLPVEARVATRGREQVSPYVTLQTGEQPDDRFFNRGRIIITTYDQVLSGLLDQPYGLSERLHNINAAAVAGALVVFDEFHLMEPHRAFLTAAAGLHLFSELCQSVWMTATATWPLVELIGDAMGAVAVPETEVEWKGLLNSLPSVTRVSRSLANEKVQLSADAVLQCHVRRSIVLLNTVARSQEMFGALQQLVKTRDPSIDVMLLHSRFFKEDRRRKEERLRTLFGRNSNGQAILVATQVVEAGLDISCEHLHTELCPMNALVQRSGRCARFEGETGIVHVYPLPIEERAWLPYGDTDEEEGTLTRTRELLGRIDCVQFDPSDAVAWVQAVHGDDDEQALREGWRLRLTECLRRIEQNAILRAPKRVADLIRGEDTDSIRVIINDTEHRPSSPGEREGLSLSRRSLYRLFRDGQDNLGWYWDAADDEPWKPLIGPAEVNRTYVVCLRPTIAAYDDKVGLRLGFPGSQESPDRKEPPRPGYAPYRAEAWTNHARRVAEEGERRLDKDGWGTGLISVGFQRRYGLTPDAMLEAVRGCGLLHDLGKLQEPWQRWAAAAQRSQHANYEHVVPLAHTDFDPESEEDRQRERNLGLRRPAHAPASAYYGAAFLSKLLRSVPEDYRTAVASACISAVLAHHGGWAGSTERAGLDLGIARLAPAWENELAAIFSWKPENDALNNLQAMRDKRSALEMILGVTTGPEHLRKWWPLVAYLTRTLRLSDQRATAEMGCNE